MKLGKFRATFRRKQVTVLVSGLRHTVCFQCRVIIFVHLLIKKTPEKWNVYLLVKFRKIMALFFTDSLLCFFLKKLCNIFIKYFIHKDLICDLSTISFWAVYFRPLLACMVYSSWYSSSVDLWVLAIITYHIQSQRTQHTQCVKSLNRPVG